MRKPFQQFESINEESGESRPDVSSEYELSSRSKRKMSRDPGIFEGATRAVSEMLAGVSGVDILSDAEDDFSNDILMKVSALRHVGCEFMQLYFPVLTFPQVFTERLL